MYVPQYVQYMYIVHVHVCTSTSNTSSLCVGSGKQVFFIAKSAMNEFNCLAGMKELFENFSFVCTTHTTR